MSRSSQALTIGTRGSALALYQAHAVRDRLAQRHGLVPETIAIHIIRTTGDAVQDRPLAEIGGKGLFTKEIEEALLAGTIDLAVHSAKDVPTWLPDGLVLTACLPREDVRDVFISHQADSLATLPAGARVGTTSPRRQALIKRMRPDLAIVPLRGNVDTRLRKLEEGVADATILALAGLKRLELTRHITRIMSIEEFLPAAGQGAIAIETRAGDGRVNAMVAAIDDADTSVALAAERALLDVLDGTCKTPIAAHASVTAAAIELRGLIARPDGSAAHDVFATGARADAARIGGEAGRELKRRAGPDFLV
ncbi:MAG: hydroxymethylbilane synthase [Rhizobiales bacterium]|nr:hydroxymethylbilane synthase [Hyphomicrobiales bacterium]OJY44778.1 MAG: hydroxymethylbilane synthase [Rhizobiales bacterium 64-17]